MLTGCMLSGVLTRMSYNIADNPREIYKVSSSQIVSMLLSLVAQFRQQCHTVDYEKI